MMSLATMLAEKRRYRQSKARTRQLPANSRTALASRRSIHAVKQRSHDGGIVMPLAQLLPRTVCAATVGA